MSGELVPRRSAEVQRFTQGNLEFEVVNGRAIVRRAAALDTLPLNQASKKNRRAPTIWGIAAIGLVVALGYDRDDSSEDAKQQASIASSKPTIESMYEPAEIPNDVKISGDNKQEKQKDKPTNPEPTAPAAIESTPPEPAPSASPEATPSETPDVAKKPIRFNAATFNIFHSTGDGARDWKIRLDRSIETLNKANIDVAGLQEARPNQQQRARDIFASESYKSKDNIPYKMYPDSTKKRNFNANPIVWNNDIFEFIKAAPLDMKYFGGSNKEAPAVLLKVRASGQKLWFVNTHDPADTAGEADIYRLRNAKGYVTQLKEIENTAPIVFVGDFNSGLQLRTGNNNTKGNDRDNLTYKELVESGVVAHASDMVKHDDKKNEYRLLREGDSRTDVLGNDPIDHIFLSPKEFDVLDYNKANAGRKRNGSDVHPMIWVRVEVLAP